MEKEFVPYELALKLKELGFNEECLAFYFIPEIERTGDILLHFTPTGGAIYDNVSMIELMRAYPSYRKYLKMEHQGNYVINTKFTICTPLWQQVFDWFRDQYGLHAEIRSYTAKRFTFVIQELKNTVKYIEYGGINNTFKTYQEARQACLEKLIGLCGTL